MLFISNSIQASNTKNELRDSYKEYSVTFNLKNYGTFSSDALYFNTENKLYVSVTELFRYLNIPCLISEDNNLLRGYIPGVNENFTVDFLTKSVQIGNLTYFLGDSLMQYNKTLFIESSQFGKIFNVDLTVDMANRSVDINPGTGWNVENISGDSEKHATSGESGNLYEEFSLIFTLKDVGVFSSDALYFNTENKLFVSVTEMFRYMNIPCNPSDEKLTGYIANESNKYVIDIKSKTVQINNMTYLLGDSLMTHDNSLYMELSQFGRIFNIEVSFDFNKLSVFINPGFELSFSPVQSVTNAVEIKDMSQNEITVNFSLTNYGRLSSEAIYFSADNKLFVSVEELFNFLKISYQSAPGNDVMTGFLLNDKSDFRFDYVSKSVQKGNVKYFVGDSLIKHKNALFLETSQFSKIFNISLNFDSKSQTINVNSGFESDLSKTTKAEKMPFGEDVDYIYEELPITFNLTNCGQFTSEALYYSLDNKLYVSIAEFFNYLKIQCLPDIENDGLTGFIKTENNIYHISNTSKSVMVGTTQYFPGDSLLKYKNTLYLESSQFGKIFNIYLQFDIRKLMVNINSGFELPVARLMKLEQMKVLGDQNSIYVVDTTIQTKKHALGLGTFDWAYSTSQLNGNSVSNRIMLGLGAEVLGGSLVLKLDQNDRNKFNLKQQQYLWTLKNYDSKILKEINIGKISRNSIATYYFPVNGIQISNISPGSRTVSGYYTVEGVTEPGWIAHLYVNNQLFQTQEVDASGKYEFKVPLKYGKTNVVTKVFGPSGEERIEEKNINIPYNFVPSGKFEYALSSGVFHDGKYSRYMRSENYYGVSHYLTLGGGADYISGFGKNTFIPFGSISAQPFSRINFNWLYALDVYSKVNMNIRFNRVYVDLKYTMMHEGQTAVNYQYQKEKGVKIVVPYVLFKNSGIFNFEFNEKNYGNFDFNTYNFSNTFTAFGIKTQFRTSVNHVRPTSDNESIMKSSTYANSSLNIIYKLFNKYDVSHGLQYNISKNNPVDFTTSVSRNVNKHFSFSASFYKSFLSASGGVNFSVVYSFDIMKVNAGAGVSNGNLTTYESVAGGLYYSGKGNNTKATNSSCAGKGGLILHPFLDLNYNGKYDEGEPKIKLSTVRINSGIVNFDSKDTVMLLVNLDPFQPNYLELNENDLENISWSYKYKSYKIIIEPNQFKDLEIPILAHGEASGKVLLSETYKLSGISQIIVEIYNQDEEKVAEILTESDGYFSYMGLRPGKYVARINRQQMETLDYYSDPQEIKFEIKATNFEDVFDDIVFFLIKKGTQDEYDVIDRTEE